MTRLATIKKLPTRRTPRREVRTASSYANSEANPLRAASNVSETSNFTVLATIKNPAQASDVAHAGVNYRLRRSVNFSTSTTSATRTFIVSLSSWTESTTKPLIVSSFNPLSRPIPLQGMNCVERNSAPQRAENALPIVTIPVTLWKKVSPVYRIEEAD